MVKKELKLEMNYKNLHQVSGEEMKWEKKCEFGDVCPPNICNGPDLKKVKQEIRDNKLGI